MKTFSQALPCGVEILDAGSRNGTGNRTLLFRDTQPPRVLKLYRMRRSHLREHLHDFSERFLEGKSGALPLKRWTVERTALEVWKRAGFDVPQIICQPLPAGIAPPAMWLEWIDGNLLSDSLRDPAVPVATKLAWIATYATATGRRHHRAVATSQTLLIHEHPGPKHVIVAGERLVSFDFEHVYLPGLPIMEAAAEEITNFLYSLECLMGPDASQFIETYVHAYGQGSLLSDFANCILYGRSRRRRGKRWVNKRQQRGQRKTALMQKVIAHLIGL